MSDRLAEIEARLAEVNHRTGREVWHGPGCASDAGCPCDCWRADIEWLVDRVRARAVERCGSVHAEGARSWRCQLLAGHDGDHRSITGRRRWQTRTTHPLSTGAQP
jgi:hypothetical protein